MCIERKMNLDEICQCYCKQRGRFTREFERAQSAGAKMYLLIENADWEKAYSGDYRSQMAPSALINKRQTDQRNPVPRDERKNIRTINYTQIAYNYAIFTAIRKPSERSPTDG